MLAMTATVMVTSLPNDIGHPLPSECCVFGMPTRAIACFRRNTHT
jgi:hypothetical protein